MAMLGEFVGNIMGVFFEETYYAKKSLMVKMKRNNGKPYLVGCPLRRHLKRLLDLRCCLGTRPVMFPSLSAQPRRGGPKAATSQTDLPAIAQQTATLATPSRLCETLP